MRARQCGLLVLLTLPISGCFDDPVALPQGRQLEPAALGEWQCEEVAEAGAQVFAISIHGPEDGQYQVTLLPQGDEAQRYRAYPALVAGVEILSLGGVEESPGPSPARKRWAVVQLTRAPEDTMLIDLPAARLFRLPEAEALQALRTKAHEKATWEPWARCRRKTEVRS